MTTAAARLPRTLTSVIPIGVAACGLAVMVGVAVAVDPRLGAALAFAALALPIALLDLPLMIALWTALIVFSRVEPFGQLTSATALVVIAAWLAHVRAGRISIRAALHPHRHLLTLLALLLVWLTLSLAWSQDLPAATSNLVDWFMNAAAVVVLLTSIRTPREMRLVVVAAVFAVVAAVGLALAGIDLGAAQASPDVDATSEERLQGVIGDPNFMAAFIVPAAVLSATLRGAARTQARVLFVPATILLVIGLTATASRGGLLAALAALATAVVVMRGRRAAVLGAGTAVLLVAAVWFSANPAALERVQMVSEDRGSGREDLWIVARRVSADHPVGGVGLGNFTVRSREYVRRPGALEYVELVVERPHVVHNTYLQMLAETGVVGLALFLAILFAMVASAVRAARRFERQGERMLAHVSQAVVAAQVGLLTAAIFISMQQAATFWVLLLLGPILFGLASAPDRGSGNHRVGPFDHRLIPRTGARGYSA